jgi:hypothetical protein
MHANVSHPPLHLHNSLENLLLLQRRCSVSQRYKPHNPRAKRNGCARHPATHQAHSKSWLPTPAWAEKACSRQHACVQSAIIKRHAVHGVQGRRAWGPRGKSSACLRAIKCNANIELTWRARGLPGSRPPRAVSGGVVVCACAQRVAHFINMT